VTLVPRNPLQQRLISIVEPVCNAAGFELIDLRYVLEQGGWTLRVAVDLPLDAHTDPHQVPSDRVDLEDCENLSRELSAVLDVEDPIPQAFSLEVSSPGIDRPLRTPAHYAYFAGSEAKIQLGAPLALPGGERRNFKGTLQGFVAATTVASAAGGEGKVVILCDGVTYELALEDIEHAKLVPDWDAVMRGGSGAGSPLPKPKKPGQRPSQRKQPRDGGGAHDHRNDPRDAREPRETRDDPRHQGAPENQPRAPGRAGADAENKEQG
jgi:ribosome maturation factor RimP